MAFLIILVIIAGCAAYQYFKGTLVNSFVTIITIICAGTVAFGYFEPLANTFVSRSDNSSFSSIVPWAQPLSFILLFVLVFAILQTITPHLLLRQTITLDTLTERIGRVVCGIFLGFMLTGLLLTVMAMAPLPGKYPYQRFDSENPDPQQPNRALLNPDGFTAGWFSLLSKGCFSGKTSFAALHPGFIDQLFLNRHNISSNVPITDSAGIIEVQDKNAIWLAPENLKDTESQPLKLEADHDLTIVRIGIKRGTSGNDVIFTLSQLRLICRQKGNARDPFTGAGQNIYPIGYFKYADQVELKNLGEKIILKSEDFKGGMKWIDFVFYVPSDSTPVLAEFRQNSISRLPPLTPAEQAPEIIPFSPPPLPEKPTVDANNIPDPNTPADVNQNG